MVRCDREALATRQPRVQDGRDCVGRILIHRSRVAIPGGIAREAGEVRKAVRIQVAAGVHERARRKFVEDHEDDGSARRAGVGPNIGPVREHQVRHVGEQQEQRREHHRGGGENAEQRAGGVRTCVDQHGADGTGQGENRRGQGPVQRQHLEDDRGYEKAQDHQMQGPPERLAHPAYERLGAKQEQRRDDRQPQGEEDDRRTRPPARREELRVVAEHMQERRHHGETPEGGKMGAALGQRHPPAPRWAITAHHPDASEPRHPLVVRHTGAACALSAWPPRRPWPVAPADCAPGLRPSDSRGCRPSRSDG